MLLLGESQQLLEAIGIPRLLPDGSEDTALIAGETRSSNARRAKKDDDGAVRFIAQLGMHRDFRRETDPARV